MKKTYTKRKLAESIINSNVEIFIPPDMLLDDLDYLYKIKRITKKIMKGYAHDEMLLRNLLTIANNIFNNHAYDMLNLILSDDEMQTLTDQISKSS